MGIRYLHGRHTLVLIELDYTLAYECTNAHAVITRLHLRVCIWEVELLSLGPTQTIRKFFDSDKKKHRSSNIQRVINYLPVWSAKDIFLSENQGSKKKKNVLKSFTIKSYFGWAFLNICACILHYNIIMTTDNNRAFKQSIWNHIFHTFNFVTDKSRSQCWQINNTFTKILFFTMTFKKIGFYNICTNVLTY